MIVPSPSANLCVLGLFAQDEGIAGDAARTAKALRKLENYARKARAGEVPKALWVTPATLAHARGLLNQLQVGDVALLASTLQRRCKTHDPLHSTRQEWPLICAIKLCAQMHAITKKP